MKFSEAWLRELVNPNISTEVLVDQLTMAGLEVDGFQPVAVEFTDVVVGEILAVETHPGADKLVICTVDNGIEKLQVVCGAPNAREGIKVPFAKIGAEFPELKIKKAKLRGVESNGMLCSELELGLSDNNEGLLELAADAPVGADIRDYLGLDDVIIDLDGDGLSCGTGDNFVSAPPEMSCDLVDMEAYALAKICQQKNVEFHCFKFVSDNANGDAANDWTQQFELGARLFSEQVLTNFGHFE